MKVTLLGTSGGIPLPNRAQSGVLVETAEIKILLDCGMGVPLRLAEAGIEAEEIDIICLTHEHLDHIQDLPSLTKASWLRSQSANYKIITPPHLPETLKKFWKSVDEYERSELEFKVLEPKSKMDEVALIEPFKTSHTSMSQGYKISIHGKEMVYTGDTRPISRVKEVSEDADLLIHELSHLEKTEGHTDPEEFISKFSDIEVDRLVMTHFYPEIERTIDEITANIEKETCVSTYTATDLLTISLGD